MPLYEAKIKEDGEDTGIDLISFVEQPAIEVDWVYMSAHKVLLKQDDEQMIVTGPAIIPDVPITRGDHYIIFRAGDIKLMAQKFFLTGNPALTNIDHDSENIEGGAVLFESWIKGEVDSKAEALGFGHLPAGTWMVSYKVHSERLWKLIKAGKIRGFSIEAFLTKEKVNFGKKEDKKDYMYMLGVIRSIRALLSEVKLDEGFVLESGEEITIGEDQIVRAANGDVMAEGEYVLEDGRTIVVSAEGMLIDIKDAEADTDSDADADAMEEETEEVENPLEEATPEEPIAVESIDGEVTMILDGQTAQVVAEGQISGYAGEGEYILNTGEVISVDVDGNYETVTAGDLLKEFWSLKSELSKYKSELSVVKREFKEFKRGFGGTDEKLSVIAEIDTPTKSSATNSLQTRLNKFSGFMKK